jgi:ABC-type uncharacterized transport system substrate-binding protein
VRLSTIFQAAIYARIKQERIYKALDLCIDKLDDKRIDKLLPKYQRANRQAIKFLDTAIQLADEQHDLILVQAQLLERFEMAMAEAHG